MIKEKSNLYSCHNGETLLFTLTKFPIFRSTVNLDLMSCIMHHEKIYYIRSDKAPYKLQKEKKKYSRGIENLISDE